MFILAIAQVPPLNSWPNNDRSPLLPPCSSTYSLGVDEHAAGAAAGVVDPHPLLGFDEADHHPDDGARCVELAALLASGVGELGDQVLVGGAEDVRELEVLVAQPVPGEVVDELLQALVCDGTLAYLAVEVDVLDDAVESRVFSLKGSKGLVEEVADTLRARVVPDVLPARLSGTQKLLP